jgi:hypothetical protein
LKKKKHKINSDQEKPNEDIKRKEPSRNDLFQQHPLMLFNRNPYFSFFLSIHAEITITFQTAGTNRISMLQLQTNENHTNISKQKTKISSITSESNTVKHPNQIQKK